MYLVQQMHIAQCSCAVHMHPQYFGNFIQWIRSPHNASNPEYCMYHIKQIYLVAKKTRHFWVRAGSCARVLKDIYVSVLEKLLIGNQAGF